MLYIYGANKPVKRCAKSCQSFVWWAQPCGLASLSSPRKCNANVHAWVESRAKWRSHTRLLRDHSRRQSRRIKNKVHAAVGLSKCGRGGPEGGKMRTRNPEQSELLLVFIQPKDRLNGVSRMMRESRGGGCAFQMKGWATHNFNQKMTPAIDSSPLLMWAQIYREGGVDCPFFPSL